MITWDEDKRRKNLKKHGIDFADVESVFDRPLQSEQDRTGNYGELRLRSLGLFNGRVVVMIWVPRLSEARIISCRYGEKHETRAYFKNLFHSGRN